MSLDVSVYRRFELLKAGKPDDAFELAHEEELGESIEYLYACPDFPDHAEGIADGYYRVERPGQDVSLNLRASYFNFWRDQLCRLCTGGPIDAVWSKQIVAEAFMPLLDFGDCEGLIGPVRCAQLAADFAKWADRAAEHGQALGEAEGSEVGEGWLETYRRWRAVFEAVGPSGVVHYH
jgi:hypothetical protein